MRALATIVLLLAQPAWAQQPATEVQRVVYDNVSIIDIHDGAQRDDMAIVVVGERIEKLLGRNFLRLMEEVWPPQNQACA